MGAGMPDEIPTANLVSVVAAARGGKTDRILLEAGTRAAHDMGKASGLRGAAASLLEYLGKRRVLTRGEIEGAAGAFREAADKLDANARASLDAVRKTTGGP